jgi:low temperature requirement protein LtrA
MFGCFLMAAAVPAAFAARGMVFAGAYLAVQVGRALTLVVITRPDQQHRPATRLLFWLTVSAIPWLAGAAAQGWAREALWGLAVTIDYTAAALRFPAPRLGRASWAEFGLEGEYLAERHRQFFIIALGELILASGLALSSAGLTAEHTAPAVVAFATTALLGRVYIHPTGDRLGTAITTAPDPYRVTVLATYAQPVMLASIVPISAANEAVIQHPLGHTRPALTAAILGGPAVFLAGRALSEYAVYARMSRAHLIGVGVLAAVSPAMSAAPPLLAALTATAVLAAVALSHTVPVRPRVRRPLDVTAHRS